MDGVFYGRDLIVSDARSMKPGSPRACTREALQVGVASGLVDRLCLGPELRERPGLAFFKKTMGVGVVQVPTLVVIPAAIRMVMRRVSPGGPLPDHGNRDGSRGRRRRRGPPT